MTGWHWILFFALSMSCNPISQQEDGVDLIHACDSCRTIKDVNAYEKQFGSVKLAEKLTEKKGGAAIFLRPRAKMTPLVHTVEYIFITDVLMHVTQVWQFDEHAIRTHEYWYLYSDTGIPDSQNFWLHNLSGKRNSISIEDVVNAHQMVLSFIIDKWKTSCAEEPSRKGRNNRNEYNLLELSEKSRYRNILSGLQNHDIKNLPTVIRCGESNVNASTRRTAAELRLMENYDDMGNWHDLSLKLFYSVVTQGK